MFSSTMNSPKAPAVTIIGGGPVGCYAGHLLAREHINTTIIDVLQNQLFPEGEQREPDKEVLRYREALLMGYREQKKIGISNRLILSIHKELIPNGDQGYRRQQNRITNSSTGEVIYTPPIASSLPSLIGNWEKYVNDKSLSPDPLVSCAVAHYQFEAIHPFSDGNGRTGRILMVLQLVDRGLLRFPILFISGYINKHRSKYYRVLRNVTARGEWDAYLAFMLKGYYEQAKETKELLLKIRELFFEYKKVIKSDFRNIYSADLVELMFSYPVLSPVKLARKLGIHYTTASRHLRSLTERGLLSDLRFRNYHLFVNEKLLAILSR